jgi:hypothetical protein
LCDETFFLVWVKKNEQRQRQTQIPFGNDKQKRTSKKGQAKKDKQKGQTKGQARGQATASI